VDASPSLTETSLPVRPPPNTPDPQPAAAGLETEDWDLLFRAVLETLARTACGRAPSDGAVSLLQAPGDVLDGCLDALEQLRRSAPFVQHPLMPKGGASGTSGATWCALGTPRLKGATMWADGAARWRWHGRSFQVCRILI